MSLNKNLILATGVIILLALSRIIPHPPNFTPILSMAFFAGAILDKRLFAYFVIISSMLISDLYLGFHSSMLVVYFSISLSVLLGTIIHKRLNIINGVVGLSGSVLLFYLITNFAVWYGSGMYTNNFQGLIECYILAIPFLQNTISSTLLYSLLAFSVYYLADKYINFRLKRV